MFRRQCAAALRDGGNRCHLDEARETRNKEGANHDSRRSHPASPCATVAQTPSYRVRRQGGPASLRDLAAYMQLEFRAGRSTRPDSARSGSCERGPGVPNHSPAPFGRDVVKNHGEVIGRLAWLSKAARHPPIMKHAPIAEESAFSRARVSRRPSRGQLLRSNSVAPRPDEYGRSAARSGNPGNVG